MIKNFQSFYNSISSIYIKMFFLIFIIITIYINGLNLSTEFIGGTLIELEIYKKDNLKNYYNTLLKIQNDLENEKIKIQYIEEKNNLIVKIPNDFNKQLTLKKLNKNFQKYNIYLKIKKIEYIKEEINKNFILKSLLSLTCALFIIFIYIIYRFNMKLAYGALFALFHDIIIILALFSITKIEFDLSSLTAISVIVGYSINNTIVIFNRLNTNIQTYNINNINKPLNKLLIVNKTIKQTLSRTINTSFLTLITTCTLMFFGGKTLFSFSFTCCVGIISGIYSSIFLATLFFILF